VKNEKMKMRLPGCEDILAGMREPGDRNWYSLAG
jgi:hypothetical protein